MREMTDAGSNEHVYLHAAAASTMRASTPLGVKETQGNFELKSQPPNQTPEPPQVLLTEEVPLS